MSSKCRLMSFSRRCLAVILPPLVAVSLASCASPPPQPVSPCSGVQKIQQCKDDYVVGSAKWWTDTHNDDGTRVSLPADWIESKRCMSIVSQDLQRQIEAQNQWIDKNCPKSDKDLFKPADLPPAE